MIGKEIDQLIQLFAKLPGLGPRSARRAVLHLLKRRETVMAPLATALSVTAERIQTCATCGNLDTSDPCHICNDSHRDPTLLCVVEEVGDLWALERSGVFRGRYHVLGGTLSALEGVGPDDLSITSLLQRANRDGVREVILALNATVGGQTTAHYLADRLSSCGVSISRLALGVPIGGELDHLDDGTLTAAMRSRRAV